MNEENQTTVSEETNAKDVQAFDISNYQYGCVVTNQDIFYGTTLMINKNHGYEYDFSKEAAEKIEEVVRIKENTIIYSGPSIIYNEVGTYNENDVIVRIKKGVNTVDNHIWDKVTLGDGTEGYVFSENIEQNEEYERLKFEYNDKQYDICILQKQESINLKDYPYYLVTNNYSLPGFVIYYSKNKIEGTSNYYNFEECYLMTVNYDGSISKREIKDTKYSVSNLYKFIITNHNIKNSQGKIYFQKNHGYEYDFSKETIDTLDEGVRITKEINVYKGPSIVYDEMGILQENNVVIRLKRKVNEADNEEWDKVRLSDGTEGYIYSKNAEITNEYKRIKINYNDFSYDVCVSNNQGDADLKNYPYYLITSKDESDINIYFSVSKIKLNNYGGEHYVISNGCIKVSIRHDGKLQTVLNHGTNTYSDFSKDYKFIASNHNLLCEGKVVYEKNHGYEYDFSKETPDILDEVVRLKEGTTVYKGPSIEYDEIGTLQENSSVVRIKKEITETDNEKWDKIKLSDGTEGYIYSKNTEIINDYTRMDLNYNDTVYDICISNSQGEENLKNYPFYVITASQDNSQIKVFFSVNKIKLTTYGGERYNFYNGCIVVSISNKDKLQTISNHGTDTYSVLSRDAKFIASNHNLMYEGNVVYKRNHGYNYDFNSESKEEIDEVVRVKEKTIVYDGPTITYDEIGTLKENDTIIRIKKEVNERDGEKWDKVKLSDGKEGYIFSKNIQEVKDGYERLKFDCEDYKYDVNILHQQAKANLKEYPFYVITQDYRTSLITIFFSKSRITVLDNANVERYKFAEGYYSITINHSGDLLAYGYQSKSSIDIDTSHKFIASNQNIYKEGKLKYERNFGYIYDFDKEKTEKVDEVVKVKGKTIVYTAPTINYDEIGNLNENDLVVRVKKEVNKTDDVIWDKIKLGDGTEGYIHSDDIEIMDSEYERLKFEYNDKAYDICVSDIRGEVNLKDYPFYVITTDNQNIITVFYSKSRIKAVNNASNTERYLFAQGYYSIIVNNNDKLLKYTNHKEYSVEIGTSQKYIATNQDIFKDKTLRFKRNHGYEYDYSKESKKELDEIVKVVNEDTIVYTAPAINYNEIGTLKPGDVTIKIKDNVNTINEHEWDKIKLANGTEGYVHSENLVREYDYKRIRLNYEDGIDGNEYDLCFSNSQIDNINLRDYPYYVAAYSDGNKKDIKVYFCKNPVIATQPTFDEYYWFEGGRYIITINEEGQFLKYQYIPTEDYENGIREALVIGNNHDIYKDDKIKHEKSKDYYELKDDDILTDEMARLVFPETGWPLRKEPSEDSEIIKQLHSGDVVKILQISTTDSSVWTKIVLDDETEGYILNACLASLAGLDSEEVEVVKTYFRANNMFGYNEKIDYSYNQTLYNMIRGFQAMNSLEVTGVLEENDATWKVMGLDSETNYQKYLEMAKNYKLYDNKYGMPTYKVASSNQGIYFEIDKKYADIPQKEEWEKRAAEYGTMSGKDLMIKGDELKLTLDTLTGLSKMTADILPRFSKGIEYYLEASGATVLIGEEDVKKLFTLENESEVKSKYEPEIINAVKHMLRIDNEKADFCTSIAMSMPLSGIKLSRTYMDFEGLLGNYYLYIQGDAIKNESNYYINSKWQVYDYYDFDTYEQVEQYLKEEEKIEQIEEIIGTAVAELHYAGLARFYYITGSIDAFNGMVE